ncbi:S-adenosyl-L-methionine-dependent methyltransferase [Chloropicon primus]|uniref:Methyltransferase-like protein 5 n=2 Tax=Chloropicon primus TaxID=1764295 RepID=A0A5B8MPL0_9CHLO|nr:S-adenosyl-L-methionine-dependent methyltransferase [Chloropicon primus]UPR01641.1 S-adenosyl-L-methionine-dependent methyltransferase [Chloropicon primus]|eukprot:QDZ22423.1 S-adenosyl-L-methionine-dependent methyltransferase [Chloropicon primus]
MKLKDLQSLLQDCKPFEEPKVELEQYTTRPHIAAHILHAIHNSYEGFDDTTVVDLGCGAGALGVGAAILGGRIIGIDIDKDALAIAQENAVELNPWEEDLCIDFVNADVLELVPQMCEKLKADVVITNPPFGTRTKGVDIEFLKVASQIATSAVYSLHKSSTRSYIQRHATKVLGFKRAQVVAELRYDLPKTYKFHKKACKDIEVDFWRFEVK